VIGRLSKAADLGVGYIEVDVSLVHREKYRTDVGLGDDGRARVDTEPAPSVTGRYRQRYGGAV
jgi:hypothetical protein